MKKKVLVIEDNKNYYQDFSYCVSDFPELELIDVGPIQSLNQALENIDKISPDLVLMDHHLTVPDSKMISAEGLIISHYIRGKMKDTQIISVTDDIGHNISNVRNLYSGLRIAFYTGKDLTKVNKALRRIIYQWKRKEKQIRKPVTEAYYFTNFSVEMNRSLQRYAHYVEGKKLVLKPINSINFSVSDLPKFQGAIFLFFKKEMEKWRFFEGENHYDRILESVYSQGLTDNFNLFISMMDQDYQGLSEELKDYCDFIWKSSKKGINIKDFLEFIF